METENVVFAKDQKAQMVRGSLWLSAGNLISRLLGAIYIIPWYAWMATHGDQANGLFSMGYNVYALFLLISTAGIPGAVAKQTAKYNAQNEYKVARKLFYAALKAMGILGAIFAVVLYLASPALAEISGGGKELIPVMRSLAVAVFVFPSMSVIRGFFQGNNEMAPAAISQIVEQVARVIYMLLATFMIMKLGSGDYVQAVVHSTFAAFVGMLASYGVLLWFIQKEKPVWQKMEEMYGVENRRISSTELLLETIRQAIPFIIVASGVQLFKMVDQMTFVNFMKTFTNYSGKQLLQLFATFSSNPDKLTMVIVAFATSISLTGLPLITENFTLGKKRDLAVLVSNNIQLFFFVMLPSVAGMILLAKPLYTIFYAPDVLGVALLKWTAFQCLFLGFYMLISNMLQGMYENRLAVKFLLIGLLIKMVVQYPLIRLFEVYGPILSTFIGFSVAIYLNVKQVQRVSHFNLKKVAKRVLLLLLLTLLMGIVTFAVRQLLGIFLDSNHKLTAFLLVLLTSVVGGSVYIYLTLLTRIADLLLGKRVENLRRKLGLK